MLTSVDTRRYQWQYVRDPNATFSNEALEFDPQPPSRRTQYPRSLSIRLSHVARTEQAKPTHLPAFLIRCKFIRECTSHLRPTTVGRFVRWTAERTKILRIIQHINSRPRPRDTRSRHNPETQQHLQRATILRTRHKHPPVLLLHCPSIRRNRTGHATPTRRLSPRTNGARIARLHDATQL